MVDLTEQLPRYPRLLSKERALIEYGAALIVNGLASKIVMPTYEAAVQPDTRQDGPYTVQQLITGPNSGAALESVYTVAGGSALWPLSVMCRLTASAAAADRTVALEYRTGMGLRYLVAGTQAAVQALGVQAFCWYPQAGEVIWPVEDAAVAPLPQQHIYPGSQLALRIYNGQAGDVLDQVLISARLDALPSHD